MPTPEFGTRPNPVDGLAERIEKAAFDAANRYSVEGFGLGPYPKPEKGGPVTADKANFQWAASSLAWEMMPLVEAAGWDPAALWRLMADKYDETRKKREV